MIRLHWREKNIIYTYIYITYNRNPFFVYIWYCLNFLISPIEVTSDWLYYMTLEFLWCLGPSSKSRQSRNASQILQLLLGYLLWMDENAILAKFSRNIEISACSLAIAQFTSRTLQCNFCY